MQGSTNLFVHRKEDDFLRWAELHTPQLKARPAPSSIARFFPVLQYLLESALPLASPGWF